MIEVRVVAENKLTHQIAAVIADVKVVVRVKEFDSMLPAVNEKASEVLEQAVANMVQALVDGALAEMLEDKAGNKQNQRRRKPKAIKKKK